MAARKTAPAGPIKTQLTQPVDEARSKIETRIEIGEQLLLSGLEAVIAHPMGSNIVLIIPFGVTCGSRIWSSDRRRGRSRCGFGSRRAMLARTMAD
jgi:hypothetical protein